MAKKSKYKKKWCEGYRARGQQEKNKKIRLARHVKKFPSDGVGAKALQSLGKVA